MKIPVYSMNGKVKGSLKVDKAFSNPVRNDLIQRAVLAEQSKLIQAYGSDPQAGKRTSAHYHGRRGRRMTMMNREMARMKRIHGSGGLHMRARFVPQAVKGMKAHPPKAGKKWAIKINKKERIKALLSAASASSKKEMVEKRGHILDGVKHVPLVIEDKMQDLKKVKEIKEVLEKLGLKKELERVKERKVRAGRGTARGRKYRVKKGPLLVVGKDGGITKAVRNLAGVDIVEADNLNVSMLAPGTQPGRLCLWTESAVKKMETLGD
ncbi:MAG: 50S ribosomal protein L4 [Candidatus Aenigmarchaeota archaeon]|nr:50S ribosomal protein L4 [Candidatus Aenigmarchaeota archaeon]